MRFRLLTAATLMIALVVGCMADPDRAEKPAFKGMELYSWKPEGKDWHFSLLVGTNRLKPAEEIKKPENTVVGTEELKKRLAKLAKGESVFWRNLADETVPKELEQEMRAFCETIEVRFERI